jgi:hypothetical protein
MKKFVLRWVIVFVVANALGFLIHDVLLKGDYIANQQLLRTPEQAQPYFKYMLLGFAGMAAAIVWIYGRGVQAKPWLGQGIRFGLALWLLVSVPMFLTYFAVQPWPGTVVAKQIFYELGMMLVVGVVTAALHKGESVAAPFSLSATAR